VTNWYVASLRLHETGHLPTGAVRRCHYLVAEADHDRAYNKALELGRGAAKQNGTFVGVDDLILVHDPPKDGSELLWSQAELTPKELTNQVHERERLHAFKSREVSPSGWYLGSIVLCEVHDEGSHGERELVWINSYLIREQSTEATYSRTIQIGRAQQDSPGSHRCGGDLAHWEFKGLQDIIALCEAPADGALLWCDELAAPAPREDGVPKKTDLTVFRWEVEQKKKGQA